jgi:hypothetical protein
MAKGILVAALISLVMAPLAAAQAPNANPPQSSPQVSVRPTTTLTGCLYREEQVPGRKPNVVERAGILEDYILAGVTVKGEQRPTGTAGSASTAVPSTGTMYKVEKIADEKLKALVGKRVEVTGHIDPEGRSRWASAVRSPTPASGQTRSACRRSKHPRFARSRVKGSARQSRHCSDPMTSAVAGEPIVELYPRSGTTRALNGTYLSHELQLRGTPEQPFVYANFVSSLDGRIAVVEPAPASRTSSKISPAATTGGCFRSFRRRRTAWSPWRLLRALAKGKFQDILQVGVTKQALDIGAWRTERGLTRQPAIAIVSRTLDFPVPPSLEHHEQPVHIITADGAPAERVAFWRELNAKSCSPARAHPWRARR